jgi:hypothetical protein
MMIAKRALPSISGAPCGEPALELARGSGRESKTATTPRVFLNAAELTNPQKGCDLPLELRPRYESMLDCVVPRGYSSGD